MFREEPHFGDKGMSEEPNFDFHVGTCSQNPLFSYNLGYKVVQLQSLRNLIMQGPIPAPRASCGLIIVEISLWCLVFVFITALNIFKPYLLGAQRPQSRGRNKRPALAKPAVIIDKPTEKYFSSLKKLAGNISISVNNLIEDLRPIQSKSANSMGRHALIIISRDIQDWSFMHISNSPI